MKFRTLSNKGEFVRENRTFPVTEPKYGYDVDKETGRRVVVVSGSSNVYQLKQEATPSTKLYNLIDRVQRTGDMSLLGESVEGYFDATALPKDLMEAKAIEIKAQNLYRALPIEEKSKYNNDFHVFMESINKQLHETAIRVAEEARAAAKSKAEGGASGE